MANIMKHVDLLDQVKLNVYPGQPTAFDPHPIRVNIEAIDKTKRVVFDTDALKTLNQKISEKASTMNIKDPNTFGYIQEFCGKMLSALAKNGLVLLEDIPDSPEDPYGKVRKELNRK